MKVAGVSFLLVMLLSIKSFSDVVAVTTAANNVICVVVETEYYDNANTYPIDDPIDISSGTWLVDGDAVDAVCRQSSPCDQMSGHEETYDGAAIQMRHRIYLKLSSALVNDHTYIVATPFGDQEFHFNERETLCESVKVNQAGYCSGATKRFANLGIYLGDCGSVKLTDLPEYTVLNENDGTILHTGTLEFFSSDTGLQTSSSGEHVYRIDLSSVPDGGPYVISVKGLGRSHPFGIGTAYTKEIARVIARGMYHQRCGIALEEPYTSFTRPSCHNHVCYDTKKQWGNGTWVEVPENAALGTIFGGYHDAADFDRRPFHTIITSLMLGYYEAFSNHFIDKQYNIPESGNGIPDFLDEALWGLKLWEHLQTEDGGVMAGTETSRHPGYGIVSAATDDLVYGTYDVMEKVTIECTGMFAHASRLVRPFDRDRADALLERAEKGWNKITADGMSDNISMLMYAALQLYLATATGNEADDISNEYHEKFREYAAAIFQNGSWPDQYLPGNTSANVKTCHFISYLLTENETDADIVETMRKAVFNGADNGGYMGWKIDKYPYPMGVTKFMGWGASTAQGRIADVNCFAWLLTDDAQKKKEYFNNVAALSDYSLGLNPLGQSYVTGLGTVQPRSPLHLDSYFTKFGRGIHDGKPIGNVPGIVIYGPTEGRSGADYQKNISDKMYPVWDSIAPQRRWADGWTLVNGNEFTTWETIVWNNCMFGFLYNAGEGNGADIINFNALHTSEIHKQMFSISNKAGALQILIHENSSSPFTVRMMELSGRVVYTTQNNRKSTILDVKTLPAGTYIVQTGFSGYSEVHRFVLSH